MAFVERGLVRGILLQRKVLIKQLWSAIRGYTTNNNMTIDLEKSAINSGPSKHKRDKQVMTDGNMCSCLGQVIMVAQVRHGMG